MLGKPVVLPALLGTFRTCHAALTGQSYLPTLRRSCRCGDDDSRNGMGDGFRKLEERKVKGAVGTWEETETETEARERERSMLNGLIDPCYFRKQPYSVQPPKRISSTPQYSEFHWTPAAHHEP